MSTVYLNGDDFKKNIFNYELEQDWKYKGHLPAIIDFYADWCGPCKAIAPVLEELANEYEGKLMIYKINTDNEAELSSLFGIQSIPTLLFISLKGELILQQGSLPKSVLIEVINEKLVQKTVQ